MRAPYQVLVIPYRIIDQRIEYCVFHRADHDQWQFLSDGGEDQETPIEAARRETFEESGVRPESILPLTSMCHVPANAFSPEHTRHWPADTYVIPEYAFAFECRDEIVLSDEHTDLAWLPYAEALNRLQWDSNRTALYELNCRLTDAKSAPEP